MPPPADKLMLETMNKNLIDQDEYPATRKYLSMISADPTLTCLDQRISTPDVSPSSPIFGMHLLLNNRSVPQPQALLKLFSSEVLP